MDIQHQVSLRRFNTFGMDVTAAHLVRCPSVDSVLELLDSPFKDNLFVLGGGSNILFTRQVDACVLKNEIDGIEVTELDENRVRVRAGAGVNWHRLVCFCVEQGYAGMENISLIPGNTGASPIQNIGAYGVEIKDMFESLEAVHVKEKTIHTFSLNDCEFGYRDSIFKRRYRNQFVITSVSFCLNRKPVYHIEYGPIRQELERMRVSQLSIRAIARAVINIRSSKLPDPSVIGNAGSFFKNPLVEKPVADKIRETYPALVSYPASNNRVKLAAGWLIEQCGWRGFRRGDAGCHQHQALVLVNHGSASGSEIRQLADEIVESVFLKFGVRLETEVNIY
jgi:UDP-N-acetylmuramate dehydrogenase